MRFAPALRLALLLVVFALVLDLPPTVVGQGAAAHTEPLGYVYDGTARTPATGAPALLRGARDQAFPSERAAGGYAEPRYDPSLNLARTSARLGGYRLAPRAADDFVDLSSSARRTHILQGDGTGGGHLWPGAAGKTPFPRSWSGDRIMHEISDVATDPIAWRGAIRQGSRTVLTGTRGGVDIRVIVDSRTGEIISGYPTNLPRNPR